MGWEYRIKGDKYSTSPSENPKEVGEAYRHLKNQGNNVELQKRSVGEWEPVEKHINPKKD